MKKGVIFVAPLGARDKKTVIFEKIFSQCPGNDYSSILYITPAVFSQRDAEKQFFSYLKAVHGKKAYIPFRSFTIKNLCAGLHEAYREGDILSDRLGPLILCDILGEKNIGSVRFLTDFLSKVRNYIFGKELSQVKEDIESQIFEEKTVRRAVYAMETLEVYEKKLKEMGQVDFESAIKNGIGLIKEYISPEILVLDGFFDPTPLELEIIKALVEKADDVYVLVEEKAEFLNFVESYVSEMVIEKLKPLQRRKSAGYYAYPSMEDEVEGIARGVKKHILEGMRPREIIVSFPQLSKYLPMLKRVFQKHGIPMNIAEYDLSGSKPFIAIEEMITSMEEDYPRNDFLSFLTSAYFPGIPEIVKEWAVTLSTRAGIVKGRQAWLSLKEILFNSTEENFSTGMQATVDEFQRELDKIINVLEKVRHKKGLSSFADAIEEVLDRFGFFDSLEQSLALTYRNAVLKAVHNIFFELRHLGQICNVKEVRIQDAAFYFKQLLKSLKGRDEDIGGVRIVPFESAAGLESRAMFFGGIVEGDLPSRPAIDPILPEKVKKVLGLPFLEYYLDRQKRYFERILNASADEPYLSYPAADGDKIFLPSPFLDWGMSLVPQAIDVSTGEDILIGEGAFKQKDFSEVFWRGKIQRDEDVKNLLLRRFGPRTFFRVTEIDAYRRCPLRFYIERFLCLEREEPPKFEVEARLWGKLAHTTMEYLFTNGDMELEVIDKELFKCLEKSLRKFPVGDFWSRVAHEIFRRLLPVMKLQESEIRKQGFRPYMVEKTLRATVKGLKLKGKIDRVDIKKSQKKAEEDKVILLDYKTGSIDKDSLQLPLYVCMWQKENTGTVEKTGFYSLRNCSIDWRPKNMGMEEFIRNALRDADDIVQKMRKGVFTPLPFKDGECRNCYHSALCKANS